MITKSEMLGSLHSSTSSKRPRLEQTDEVIDIYECKYLWTSRKINAGEELTLTYQMYDPT